MLHVYFRTKYTIFEYIERLYVVYSGGTARGNMPTLGTDRKMLKTTDVSEHAFWKISFLCASRSP